MPGVKGYGSIIVLHMYVHTEVTMALAEFLLILLIILVNLFMMQIVKMLYLRSS